MARTSSASAISASSARWPGRAPAGPRRVVLPWPGSCVDPSREAAAPAGRRVRAVLAAMAVPAEDGDVGAALVSEPPVGAVVDREPAA